MKKFRRILNEQEVKRLLVGYIGPMDRYQFSNYPPPFGQNKTAALLKKLRYFEKVVLPKLILPLSNIDEYHDRLLERVKAILWEVADRLVPDGGYSIERKKYRKTFSRSDMGVHENYWPMSRDYIEVWLGGKHSLMVQILKAAVEGHLSPEAKRFIANRLSNITTVLDEKGKIIRLIVPRRRTEMTKNIIIVVLVICLILAIHEPVPPPEAIRKSILHSGEKTSTPRKPMPSTPRELVPRRLKNSVIG